MFKHLIVPVLLFAGVSAFGQEKVVADKIAGIVGDKIILKSDLTTFIGDLIRNNNGQEVPGVTECTVMDQMLLNKALILQAEKDSLPVSDEEVEAEVDQKIRYFIQLYGGKDAFEQIAQRTVYQAKMDFMGPIREQRLADAEKKKIVADITITPTEVKDYFDKIPENKRIFYESEMQLNQIIVYPKAGHDIEKLAIDELNQYKQQVESGQRKFELLAQLYSDDPGSKDKGGAIELNRNDSKMWDPVFFSTAFRLKEGQVSPVIKSKYGYHIIQMVSRNGDDALVRHILKIPQITQDAIDEAIQKLDSIRTQIVSGALPFGAAVSKFSEDDLAKSTGGQMMGKNGTTFLTIPDLDKDMVLLLKNSNLKVGEISKPTAYKDERGKQAVRIVRLVSKSEPHRENLRDDYDRIAQRALDQKRSVAMQKWFLTKVPTFYIMIDPEYHNCSNLTQWEGKTSTAEK
jgi:peptidyl-prolyl cis-trans isomerase SurA